VAKRSYNQYCAVARGLDVIGERWTLLLVRELLLGPKRYGDLLAAATGIGTNLLAERLREMETGGLVEKVTLPPPAGSTVYRLTDTGQGLEPVVLALGRWGARYMAAPRGDDRLSVGAYFIALRARFRPDLAGDLSEAYEFRVDGRVFEVRIERGRCYTSEGQAGARVASFEIDAEALNDVFMAHMTAAEAIASGRVTVSGDPDALARFQALFPRLPPAR
jgi:DNA-binding HxlR family transcriptional regulator